WCCFRPTCCTVPSRSPRAVTASRPLLTWSPHDEENRYRKRAYRLRHTLSAATRCPVQETPLEKIRRCGGPDPVRRQSRNAGAGRVVEPTALALSRRRVRVDARWRARDGD